jgi:succinate dehydrogenase / fumarate reductase membrane anchor subunit
MSGFLTLLLVVVLTYHAYLGSVVIVEDYVHEHGAKLTLMVSLRFLFVLCGGASLFAILRIAFGS